MDVKDYQEFNNEINNESEIITYKEMKTKLQKLENGKAPGYDIIKAEQLKHIGETITAKQRLKIWLISHNIGKQIKKKN